MAITVTLPSPTTPPFKSVRPLPSSPAHLTKLTNEALPHPKPNLLSLPSSALNNILWHLLTSPQPLLLCRDASTSTIYLTKLRPAILLVNRQLYHIALPILYGSNTFTTSTAATSYEFDAHLQTLPGRLRGLIKNVKLQINWGERLWMKLPLVAAKLQELKTLKSLKLHIIADEEVGDVDVMETAVTGQGKGGRKGMMMEREGQAAKVMLKAEKKVLRELVVGLKALRVFELKGFEDGEFAANLEGWVRDGRKA